MTSGRAPGAAEAGGGIAPLLAFLRRCGLAAPDESPRAVALAGGVSSDIWRVDLRGGPVCVKRALPRLRVAQRWEAPVERNRYERRWMETAAAIVPGIAPRVLAADDAGFFAMEFLDPARYPLWKEELRAGRAEPAFAAAVGERLARVHAGTAGRNDVAQRFATDASFHALRLEPYLLATARVHPDLARALHALAERTAATRLALVHGDVSPKNILVGPDGPVLLDAECAWHGDPAFDLAFCLNHLLLKCLWTPAASARFAACFEALARAHLARVDWEPTAALEARAASLLPGLFLARVDGKSPVEYLTGEIDKERVRHTARALLVHPPERLAQVLEAWGKEIAP
ncbi:MAG: phosphotransferase [Betaproteobacteria bacterium]|nr:phosphotransferase [Betaproteobacteria bacterium]